MGDCRGQQSARQGKQGGEGPKERPPGGGQGGGQAPALPAGVGGGSQGAAAGTFPAGTGDAGGIAAPGIRQVTSSPAFLRSIGTTVGHAELLTQIPETWCLMR